MSLDPIQGRVVLVTGANSGIGFEVCRSLKRRGAEVVMAGRDAGRLEAARLALEAEFADLQAEDRGARLETWVVDLSDMRSVRTFAQRFADQHEHLDVLVNNAGCFRTSRELTPAGFEVTLATNHLGSLLLARLMTPLLLRSSQGRIVHVGSEAAWHASLDLDDLQMERGYGRAGFAAYAASKLMQVYGARTMAAELAPTDVTVNVVHPGHVATNIYPAHRWYWKLTKWFQSKFATSAEQAAVCVVRAVCDPALATTTGQFFSVEEPTDLPAALADPALETRAWELSLELLAQSEGR